MITALFQSVKGPEIWYIGVIHIHRWHFFCIFSRIQGSSCQFIVGQQYYCSTEHDDLTHNQQHNWKHLWESGSPTIWFIVWSIYFIRRTDVSHTKYNYSSLFFKLPLTSLPPHKGSNSASFITQSKGFLVDELYDVSLPLLMFVCINKMDILEYLQ